MFPNPRENFTNGPILLLIIIIKNSKTLRNLDILDL